MERCVFRVKSPQCENCMFCTCPERGLAGLQNTVECDGCPHLLRPGHVITVDDAADDAPTEMRGLGDLVERGLSAVGVTKERASKVARAIGIDDCGCDGRQEWMNKILPFPKRRRACDVPQVSEVQFCWCYWHRGAQGDEIRWSVRSVEKHFAGKAKLTIIGDRPPWFTGHVIRQPRIKKCANHQFRDMLAKMETLSRHSEVDDQFVWMMDDVLLMKPTTHEQLATPRAVKWRPSTTNSWQRRKTNTMRALCNAGLPTMDFGTHLPHVVEKEKLRDLIDDFELNRQTMLWEVLYGNKYRCRPVGLTPFFRRLTRKYKTVDEYRHQARNCNVLNYIAGVWGPGIRDFFADQFPEKAENEK